MAHVEYQKQTKLTLGFFPAALATTTTTGAFWSMEKAHHAAVVFILGTLTGDVVCSVVQGTAPVATPATTATIAGKTTTVTSLTDECVKIIEVEASELNVASGYMCIAAKAAVAGAGGIVGASVHRVPLRVEPSTYVT